MPSFLESPAAFRLRQSAAHTLHRLTARSADAAQSPLLLAMANGTLDALGQQSQQPLPPHSQHPDFLNLAGLVCEAVLEVVFVALPGFLVAYTGMFDASSQRFVAELNTMVFTPCLIFTKLASQLNADKLADLVVIPFIFAAQTLVSWLAAQAMARAFGFGAKKFLRQRNFILAMGVFGNSNSLPISLVLSLSKTISGLHWDKIPGDNDDEVAARGILYLLIFQQLGQLLRWTWGYSVLLRPQSAYEEEAAREGVEEARRWREEGAYRDDPEEDEDGDEDERLVEVGGHAHAPGKNGMDSAFGSSPSAVSISSQASTLEGGKRQRPDLIPATPADGNLLASEPRDWDSDEELDSPRHHHPHQHHHRRTSDLVLGDRSHSTNHITQFPSYANGRSNANGDSPPRSGWTAPLHRLRSRLAHHGRATAAWLGRHLDDLFHTLPLPLQKTLRTLHHYHARFWAGVWRQMNPPLWAMLAALIVASIPRLQHLFFDPGTLINNSVTRAITQSGGVAVPLILVVLGANLARSTLPRDQLATTAEERAQERRLLYASLLSRMVIPVVVMAPLLALAAKFVPVSTLDDPIFIIVCFLLTGAPSALQLAQICQLNAVFMGVMSKLLMASYVGAIFPSTLVLVMGALEVLEWAGTG